MNQIVRLLLIIIGVSILSKFLLEGFDDISCQCTSDAPSSTTPTVTQNAVVSAISTGSAHPLFDPGSYTISSVENPNLQVSAWGGASQGASVKLNGAQKPIPRNHLWTFQMTPEGHYSIASVQNIHLYLNAWGGATQGASVNLNGPMNPPPGNQLWTIQRTPEGHYTIASVQNPQLYLNAWGGATQGASIKLNRPIIPPPGNQSWLIQKI